MAAGPIQKDAHLHLGPVEGTCSYSQHKDLSRIVPRWQPNEKSSTDCSFCLFIQQLCLTITMLKSGKCVIRYWMKFRKVSKRIGEGKKKSYEWPEGRRGKKGGKKYKERKKEENRRNQRKEDRRTEREKEMKKIVVSVCFYFIQLVII